MESTVQVFGAVVFMAVVVERLLQVYVRPIAARIVGDDITSLVMPIVSSLGSVALALTLGLDVISPILGSFGVAVDSVIVGQVLTGLLVGGGSNLLHDIWPSA